MTLTEAGRAKKRRLDPKKYPDRFRHGHRVEIDLDRRVCRICGDRVNRLSESEWRHDRARLSLTEAFARSCPPVGVGCQEWIGRRNAYGYGFIASRVHGNTMAHRLAWELAHGPIPTGLLVLHHCDNPPCVRTEPDQEWPDGHLFIGTQAENMADMQTKGRGAFGERQTTSKLTTEDVRAIREQLKDRHESYRLIGVRFGVAWSTIRDIDQGRNWRHVE